MEKLSGPILDRIDLVLHIPRIDHTVFFNKSNQEEPSHTIQARVIHAVNIQQTRHPNKTLNGALTAPDIDTYCTLSKSQEQLLKAALKKGQLTGRSLHKVIKVARTIADLDKSKKLLDKHILESLHYKIAHCDML